MTAALRIKKVALGELRPDPANPRRMPKYEAESLKRSLEQFGPVEPAVVNADGTIIGGHMRVEAARQLGWTEFPVLRVDLPEEEARLLNLALNRIHGEWDEEKLSELLSGLSEGDADLVLSGFESSEIDKLLASIGEEREVPEPIDPPADPVTEPGDLITLGAHRLLCGDATQAEVYEELLGDERADICWTDPPYGVEYEGKTKDKKRIRNDGAADLEALLRDAFSMVDTALGEGAPIYVAHPAGALSVTFGRVFLDQGWRLHQTLTWIKDSMVLGHSDYHYRHEPILYGYKRGGGRRGRGGTGWYGDAKQTTVLEVARPKASREHPTMKPVELVEIGLRNSSRGGACVLDPFGGSGSTLLAAERLERRARVIELDPRYCDVIVKRWEDFTGQTAQREERIAA